MTALRPLARWLSRGRWQMTPDEIARARRNLEPHAEARLAMAMWGDEYAAQRGGSMDFWDRLSPARQAICRNVTTDIVRLAKEGKRG